MFYSRQIWVGSQTITKKYHFASRDQVLSSKANFFYSYSNKSQVSHLGPLGVYILPLFSTWSLKIAPVFAVGTESIATPLNVQSVHLTWRPVEDLLCYCLISTYILHWEQINRNMHHNPEPQPSHDLWFIVTPWFADLNGKPTGISLRGTRDSRI